MPPSPSGAGSRMPVALYALTAGSFGIGCAEFVIMGLLLQVAADLQVSIASAGLLVTGYALGVTAGAPVLTLLSRRMPRKTVLLALMVIYTVGNAACALAPDYATLMTARVLTSLTHGTFFGVGAVVATGLVPTERKASAISVMFSGLTLATLLGMPAGAWLGLQFGWRSTFWAMSLVGVISLLVIAVLVPRSRDDGVPAALREELATIARPQVLLGLLMTTFGFAGVFVVITYIQPLLTRLAGFGEAAVSPILLLFGGGMVIGNLLGGRWADRRPIPALLGSLLVLAVVLGAMALVLRSPATMIAFVGLLGVAAFATVSPLQLRVLRFAEGAGQNLASSFNIAAFNLGNAAGAWLGGLTIEHGPGLGAVPRVAALATLAGLAVALWSVRLESGRKPRPNLAACATEHP